METEVINVETATFEQWRRIGHAERLSSDQEIAAFLIRMYSENKQQFTPSLLCCHCQAPLAAWCLNCRPTPPPPQPPPPPSAQHPSHNPSSPASDSSPLSESGQRQESDQSQARMSLSADQSQARLKLTCKSDQSQAKSDVSMEFDQPKSRSSLRHQSDQSQARSNLSPDQSETRSISMPHDNSQSQAGAEASASLQSRIDQSQLHRRFSTNQNTQPGLPGKAGVVRNSALLEIGVKSSKPSGLRCGASRHTEQAPRGVCVKEERRDHDEDDDGDDLDEEVVCEMQRFSSQDETSLTKADEERLFSAQMWRCVEAGSVQGRRGEGGGGAPWKSRAVRWVLGRYHLHSPDTWEDCALLLNAALMTSATGEEWRKLALEKNLLSAKNSHVDDDNDDDDDVAAVHSLPHNPSGAASTIQQSRPRCRKSRGILDLNAELQEPRKTRSRVKRSRDLSSSQTELQDASGAGAGCSQKVGDSSRQRESTPAVSSTRTAIVRAGTPENTADLEEAGEATHPVSPTSKKERRVVTPLEDAWPVKAEAAASPTDGLLEETLASGGEEDDEDEVLFKPPLPSSSSSLSSSSLLSSLSSKPLPPPSSSSLSSKPPPPSSSSSSSLSQKTEEASNNPDAHTTPPPPPSSSSSSNNIDIDNNDTPSSSSSSSSWHYLGVGDVSLPDATQKRRSFKRSPNDRYQCKHCHSGFTHRGMLVKHIRLAHLKWRPHACRMCSATYATKTKLERHVNATHRNLRPFGCETCGASFVDRAGLLGHAETHREDREYRFFCELCGKGYYGMRELKRHMETHCTRPIRSLLCWVCGKAVRTTQYLRVHMRTHSPEKAFRCEACGHVFTSKCALRKHQTSRACGKRRGKSASASVSVSAGQAGESRKKRLAPPCLPPPPPKPAERKPGGFQCDLCHKWFSARKNVYKHKRSVHGVEAQRDSDTRDAIVTPDPSQLARYVTPKRRDAATLKFSCDLCGKRYSSQESVSKHKNIVHLGRRDYTCEVCDKTFTRHTSLIEHRRNVHDPSGKAAGPGVQCPLCHKTFAARNSLRKHVKTVHFRLLPFPCGDCGKKFASRYHLREHLKSSGHRAQVEGGVGEGEGGEGEVVCVDGAHAAPATPASLPTPALKGHAAAVTSPLTSLSTLPPPPSPLGPPSPASPHHHRGGNSASGSEPG